MIKHILIVDDQHEVRRMLRAGIETLDPEFQVLDLPSAEESLVVISIQPVDLLVTDIRLPGISGLELMKKVRRRNPGLKVILITGLLDPEIHRQVEQAGAEAFFLKPIQMAGFLDAVEQALGAGEPVNRIESNYPDPVQEASIPTVTAPQVLTLPELLTHLRQELKAGAVVLINDKGETLAQTGELPKGEIESLLVPALASALSAGTRVAISLKKAVPENLMLFKGSRYNLCVANTGLSYALIALVDNQAEFPGRIPSVVDAAVHNLLAMLEQPAPPPLQAPYDPPKVETPDEDLEKIEEVLGQVSNQIIDSDELDQFWENMQRESNVTGLGNPSILSYEQARKLGLTPEI